MKHEVTVEMPVSITFTIDDEKLSDWADFADDATSFAWPRFVTDEAIVTTTRDRRDDSAEEGL